MQDSIEDYIRITRNTKQPTHPEISKEVLLTLQRKKQCEGYAQRVVEFLMDGKLRPEAFLKLLNFINQEHYQDVIEERAVNKFCGYALCGKFLPVMPSKQFHISTKLNKIYDITERKNFCSNYCYKASCYIKDQIDTSPLWLRKEDEYPEFKLLDNNERVQPGIEIDHGIIKLKEEQAFTSVTSFTEACLDEAEEIENVDPDRYDAPEFEETEISEELKSILKKNVRNKGKGVKIGTKYDHKGVEVAEREEIVLTENLKEKNVSKNKNVVEQEDVEVSTEQKIKTNFDSNVVLVDESKKTVRFEKEKLEKIRTIPSRSNSSLEELNDLHKSIDQICKSLNIKLDDTNTSLRKNMEIVEDQLKPEEIDNKKMEEVTSTVNASENHIQRKPILIDTTLNPENREKNISKILEGDLDAIECKRNNEIKVNVKSGNKEGVKKEVVDVNKKKVEFVREVFDQIRDMPSTSKGNSNEIKDLNNTIEQICKSMNIKLTTQSNTYIPPTATKNMEIIEDRIKPVEIDTNRMDRIINKVNASDKHKQRKPILVDTTLNPESNRNREKIMILVEGDKKIFKNDMNVKDNNTKVVKGSVRVESPPKNIKKVIIVNDEMDDVNVPEAPKYTEKLVDKIKPPKENETVKQIIEKVKNIEINKQVSSDDKLQQVLQKLKSRESKPKAPILITPKINPEIPKNKKLIDIKINPVPTISTSKAAPNLSSIKTSILSWLTIDTYTFLHTEKKIKEILNEDTLNEYFEKLKIAQLQTSKQLKYMNICKKLQLKELAEEQFDNALLGTEFKPPPDYERLKEESKEMKLKIKAYYIGTMYDGKDGNVTYRNSEGGEEGSPAVLPLVETASTNAMRRKIFINAINKYVQNHIHEVYLEDYVLIEVQSMIKTFKLEAHTVVFKPQAWNIIAFILILMCSLKNEDLRKKLEESEAVAYKNRIFKIFENWTKTLDEIFSVLENVEFYVKQYITVDDK